MTIVLALLATGCFSAYFGLFVALHALPTGYRPIRHAVSDYAVGRYGRLFRIALWANAVGGLALAAGLATGVGSPALPRTDLVFLALIPLTRVAMSFFPTDLEGRRLTRSGLVHYALAIAGFTFVYLAVSDLTPVLRALDPWRHVGSLLGALAVIVPIALAAVVITMIPRLRAVFGLAERAFLISSNLWFLVVAAMLIGRA